MKENFDSDSWNFCRIDYQDQASVDTITVCNKKPERVCNLSKVELSRIKASFMKKNLLQLGS